MKTSLRHPLVGLTLTAADAGLLRYVAAACDACDCERFRFAHVVSTEAPPPTAADREALCQQVLAEVRAHFAAAEERAVCDVVHGTRLDQLLALAVKHQHDVAFLGHRRGRTGYRSLARRMAMVSPCSVWLAPEGSLPRITRILVPVDFSSHSADALEVATSLAARLGIKQCLTLHVFFDPSTVRYDEHIEEVRGEEQEAFTKFVAGIDTHGVELEPLFEESTHVADAILRVAQRHQADLIVMNTRGRSRAAAVLLGSVTSQILSSTNVPLLAVKHFGAQMSMLQALLDHHHWDDPMPKTN